MSVLACGRSGCANIMCTRLILDGKEYLCDSCYAELREAKGRWPTTMTKAEMVERILDFMDTVPGFGVELSDDDTDAEFDRLTGGDGTKERSLRRGEL